MPRSAVPAVVDARPLAEGVSGQRCQIAAPAPDPEEGVPVGRCLVGAGQVGEVCARTGVTRRHHRPGLR